MNVLALVFAAGQPGLPLLTDPAAVAAVYGSGAQASVVALVMGIMAMTGEYRSQTITATFLAEPHRGRVVAAKMAFFGITGLILGAIVALVILGLAAPLMAIRHAATISATDAVEILLAVPLAYAIYAILGVAFGALVRHQVAALVIALLWVLIVESLIVTFLPGVGRWLPGGALVSMMHGTPESAGDHLSPPLAGLLLVCYAFAFAGAATRATLRRDIT